MNITLFDTSAATDNLGDEIIMEAVESHIRAMLPDAYVFKVATHEYMTSISRRMLRQSALAFVCGTNLLSPHMWFNPRWKLNVWDTRSLGNAVLCGVGWVKYSTKADPYTRWLLRNTLAQDYVHSVRDTYTIARIGQVGCTIANTGCPTMWGLTPEHCTLISNCKAPNVIVTLNCWQADRVGDTVLFELLRTHYGQIYYWPQASHDISYFHSLKLSGVKVVSPNLASYDSLLEHEQVDFIGLRLHAGIRALQKLKRTLVISVDNRAIEIARDTNLPVVARNDVNAIEHWIHGLAPTTLHVPFDVIDTWKNQFR